MVIAVVGSGVMAERLSDGDQALTLLANTFATVAALVALIIAFEPISAQFNPLVTLAAAAQRRSPWGDAIAFVAAQIAGGVVGAMCAHAMFGLPLLSASQHARAGFPFLLGEFVASFGLLAVIESATRRRPGAVVAAVAAWIGAAYWCTASTSFANPAVTIARSLGDTFTGIRPLDVPGFIVAQIAGGAAAVWVMHTLFSTSAPRLPARRPAGGEPRVGFRHAQPGREGGRPAPSGHRASPGRRAPSGNRAFSEPRPPLRPDLRPPQDVRGPAERGPADRGPDDRGTGDPRRRRRRGGRAGGSDRSRGGQRHGAGDRGGFRPPPAESPRPEPPNRTESPQRGEFDSPGPGPRPSPEGPPSET